MKLQSPSITDISQVNPWLERLVKESAYIDKNIHYPNAEAVDHGATTNQGDRTVKDIVDAIGASLSATIIFRHNSSGNTTTYTFSTTEVTPDNIAIVVEEGAILSDGGGSADLTINGPFEHGESKCFDWTGSGSVSFGKGYIRKASSVWWGFQPGAGAAIATANLTAIQAAIDSNAPIATMPAGDYSFGTAAVATGLTIDRAIRLDGAGGFGRNVFTGTSTTKLTYLGTGVALTLDGESANGTYNIHLSHFALYGNANSTGGILIGASSTTPIMYSTLENINISYFNKAGGYGLKIGRAQSTNFLNLRLSYNYDNIIIDGANTTLNFTTCTSLAAFHRGLVIQGTTAIGLSFTNFLVEANAYEAIYIYGSGAASIDFFKVHSERNCLTGGTAPIVITGSAGNGDAGANGPINFWGGFWTDHVSTVTFALDYAIYVHLHGINLPYDDAGITITANTIRCRWDSSEDVNLWHENIVGNHADGLSIKNSKGFTMTLVADDPNINYKLKFTTGVVSVIDTTNDKIAIFKIINTTSAIMVNDADAAHFGVTSGAAKINIFPAGGFFYIQNNTAGDIAVSINVLNEGGF